MLNVIYIVWPIPYFCGEFIGLIELEIEYKGLSMNFKLTAPAGRSKFPRTNFN